MSALNQLPPDLIEAILSRLPSKSLGCFKSVSKTWYSLISTFIKTHILNFIKNNPNPKPTHLILVPNYGDEYIYSFDIKQLNTQTSPATITGKCLNFPEKWVGILGSCNGLVLANDKHCNLYLVNPSTRNSLKVPDSGGESIGKTTYGFGYDSSKDDYKVIKISYKAVSDSSDLNCTLVQLYSLRNNSWNKLPNFPYKLLNHFSQHPGVLINNNLHWLVKSSRHLNKLAIAAFSLADEKIHEIEFLDLSDYKGAEWYQLYAFGGKLFVLLYYWLNHDSFSYELWVMKEYGVPKSWTKLCIINTDIDNDEEFFAQVSNRDIFLGDCYADEISIYNMEERRFTKVMVEGCPDIYAKVYCTYVETLESLERFR